MGGIGQFALSQATPDQQAALAAQLQSAPTTTSDSTPQTPTQPQSPPTAPSALPTSSPTAPGSTTDLENRAAQAPQQLGQSLQAQQPQPQQPFLSDDNPVKPLLTQAYQQLQSLTPPPTQGGGLKRMLSNYFQGAGQSMMHSAGLPTDYDKRQQLQQNIVTLTNLASGLEQAKSHQRYMGALADTQEQSNRFNAAMEPGRETEQQQQIAEGGLRIQGLQQGIPTVHTQYTAEAIKALFPSLPADVAAQYVGRGDLNAADEQALNEKGALYQKANGLQELDYGKDGTGKNLGRWWVNAQTKQPVMQISSVSNDSRPTKLAEMAYAAANPKPGSLLGGTDSDGNQVAGTQPELQAANVKNYVKLGQAEADKVNTARQLTSPSGLFALANRDLAQFKPGELEGLAPRWNEFLSGTVGAADPRYVALRTHVNGLLSTALMQAHVGARGSGQMMEHFQDIANAGKMSAPTLQAALNAEREYVAEKAMRPKTGFGPGSSEVLNPTGGFAAWKAKQVQ